MPDAVRLVADRGPEGIAPTYCITSGPQQGTHGPESDQGRREQHWARADHVIPPPFAALRAVRGRNSARPKVWVEGAMRTQAANHRLSVGTSPSVRS